MKTIAFNIKKPLYGNFIYLRASLVDKAIQTGAMLDITIPRGRTLADPAEWKRTGKVMKKVFLRPEDPMVLIGNYLHLSNDTRGQVITPEIKKQEVSQLKLF